MLAKTGLSGNDAAVLGALFDPEASLQSHVRIDLHIQGPYDPTTLSRIRGKERVVLLSINSEKPTTYDLQRAVSSLDELISSYPQYASAWGNRAQARRLLYDMDDSFKRGERLTLVFADLTKAIELASPTHATFVTSPDNARVLASVHTHRGYLLWNASRPDAESGLLDGIQSLRGLSKDQLEELASRDFSLGGKYGNQSAQQLAVKTNPYAKLCGSIVREALQKEIQEFHQQSMPESV